MARNSLLISELETRRKTLGWSTNELGARCGIDEAFLNDWEHGIGSPRFDEIQRWLTALDFTLELVPASGGCRQGLMVDWDKHCIKVDGTPIRLTPMEWKALERRLTLCWKRRSPTRRLRSTAIGQSQRPTVRFRSSMTEWPRNSCGRR